VEHILTLARRNFDERAEHDLPAVSHKRVPAAGPGPLPGSPGIAIGPARHLSSPTVEVETGDTDSGSMDSVRTDSVEAVDPAGQWRRLVEAIATVRREIEHVRVLTLRDAGPDEAGIFDAHLTLMADSEMLADVKTRISAGRSASAAWAACLSQVEQEWAQLPDPYLRQRAQDVHAVGQQVLAALTGATMQRTWGEGILVARDLTPAEAAALDPCVVKGVVLAFGSPGSHSAILARAKDIPLVVAAGRAVLAIPDGATIVIDGGTGELHVDPAAAVLDAFVKRAGEIDERRARDLALAQEPAVSRDSVTVAVAANLGSVADARSALAAGADGAGLVRTEFLFQGRSSAPALAEQLAQYAAICGALPDRRVTLRTLDVGGDKPLAYLPMPHEQNPFLGVRGIRLSLERRDLLREQLDAICQTAGRFPVSVMFPMVSSLAELLQARQVLAEAAGPAGPPPGLRVGMMIEVPGAALKIESFLPHVDFVSIGTNDLTQYTLAAERGNAGVAAIWDALDPAVLALVHRVCTAASGRVDVAVCGEAASDELAIPILLGLGVREFSVSPSAVPRVKARSASSISTGAVTCHGRRCR